MLTLVFAMIGCLLLGAAIGIWVERAPSPATSHLRRENVDLLTNPHHWPNATQSRVIEIVANTNPMLAGDLTFALCPRLTDEEFDHWWWEHGPGLTVSGKPERECHGPPRGQP